MNIGIPFHRIKIAIWALELSRDKKDYAAHTGLDEFSVAIPGHCLGALICRAPEFG
jgi:hypothetical protein